MLYASYLSCVAACLYSADVFAPSIMSRPIPLAVLLAATVLAGCASPGSTPFVQPQAMACDALPAELEAERSAWGAPATTLGAASDAAAARPVVTLVRTRLKLQPQARLKPVALAKAEANPPDTYGGLTAFAPGRGGVFRFSASNRAWIELIDRATGKPLAPISSDKRLRCFGIPKALLFELAPGRDYLLQITASAGSELDLLVAQAAK
jgi:hypothetical protein